MDASKSPRARLERALDEPRQLGFQVPWDEPLETLAPGEMDLLRRALWHHGLLCLTGLRLDPARLRASVARWGEVVRLPAGLAFNNPEPGFPEIARVGNVRPDGTVIPNSTLAEYWHHDGDFWPAGRNHILNFLHAVRVPARGGNTGFLDTRRAFAALTPGERERLHGASLVVHASDISDFRDAPESERPGDARHDVCLPHPVTGEVALYLPESRTGIERAGIPVGASRDWVDTSLRRVGIHEHRWVPGDLLIWDNLQVMHRSMGGYFDEPRLLYRGQARVLPPH